MDADSYLQMIEQQVQDAKMSMEDAEKKYRTEKAKYDSLVKMKNDYMKWAIGGIKS